MKMKKTTAIGLFALGTLCVILGMLLKLSGWMVILGSGVALFSLSKFLRSVESDRNLRAIESALNDLDAIVGGLRIIGRDSELVDWRRVDLPTEPGPIEVAQLCRTAKGQWFEYSFSLSRTRRIFGDRMRLLLESEARGWLSYNVKLYEQVFGAVELA
ncbi:hypothetical protein PQH03_28275 [Ralstonia insidiosa]|jgi:hypothetical protein|uniref:Uncharacterized protein n=1 Tax=Ralstonia insidiosa TaxID=190721 RepID=A0A192A8B6_9RALS|nr:MULTISPECIES: hypothetical protein [Ralstonia]KMW44151.1 hypothetical protein AC240_26825 [Ralstonia sp. MD27]ANJ76552.1 hypothetical protein A9Y76_28640 [Ralstonia insidiosa]MBA9869580.1 hypothetical protein [Ralstonia insidiosa]MBA9885222.1 hypothetical protein [Ralstonia pickettii]MBA9895001.1 hypothetical protein [Ralstonia pickettii]